MAPYVDWRRIKMTMSPQDTYGSSTPETSGLSALKRLIDDYESGDVEFDKEVEGALMRLWTAFEVDAECPPDVELEWWEQKKLEYFGPER